MASASSNREILLDIRDSARRRIICGLRWDPMEVSTTSGRHAAARGGRTNATDLDLICVLFDKYGRVLGGVTGEEGHRTGDSGNVYHTGDVIDGADTLDDEQISIELFNLSSTIDQIFFIAEVQSAHTFGDMANPEIRLANAIDDRNFAHADLKRDSDSKETAYVFGYIKRTPQGWCFYKIGDFFEANAVSDWGEILKQYIEHENYDETRPKAPPSPAKGQTVPLAYTKEARHRIVCGLNWDPQDSTEAEYNPFDLDLACVMYDAEKSPVDGVSAKADETIDSSGKVYHSGDDTSGEGNRTDDEAISVELRELPDYIHHIVFIAEIQSQHNFGKLHNPSMRIADGKSNENQLFGDLGGREGRDKTAYIFARIGRGANGWELTYIDQYVNGDEVEDWIEYLKRYLG